MLSLAPLKRAVLGTHEPQLKPRLTSLPVASPAELVGSGPITAVEAVETVAPPPVLESSGLARGLTAPEASDSPPAVEPPVAATVDGGMALETSPVENALSAPSAGGHETKAPSTVQASVPVASHAEGGVT